MPEIGETLREARQRRRVDVYAVEAHTKIRAKYLRALEEEHWEQLPGPTYVKTFLRTYGEYLGLDANVLVEEYKQRFERPGPQELTPFSTNLGSRRERRRARGPLISPGAIVVGLVVVLVGALAALGLLWDDPADQPAPRAAVPTVAPTDGAAAPRTVTVRITARETVTLCVRSRTDRAIVDGVKLRKGRSRTVSGSRLRIGLGNRDVRVTVAGDPLRVPRGSAPIGYDIRAGERPVRLPDSSRPRC